MSLHKYTRVHYYEVGNKGLKGKSVLKPSSKESVPSGWYLGDTSARYDIFQEEEKNFL